MAKRPKPLVGASVSSPVFVYLLLALCSIYSIVYGNKHLRIIKSHPMKFI